MSIWDNNTTDSSLVRPGTPDIAIRLVSTAPPTWVVRADGKQVHSTKVDYLAAHRWCQNEYGLTSTPMIAVHADYEQALTSEPPPPPGPNRFRKAAEPEPQAEATPPAPDAEPEPDMDVSPLLAVEGKLQLAQDMPRYVKDATVQGGAFTARVTQLQFERLQRDANVQHVQLVEPTQ